MAYNLDYFKGVFCILFSHFIIYILDINPQSDTQLAKIITHLVGYLFTLVKVSFAVQNAIFLKINYSIEYKQNLLLHVTMQPLSWFCFVLWIFLSHGLFYIILH